MASTDGTNYSNIEQALGKLISTYTGMPGELGDFSKVTVQTPNFVVAHGRGQAKLTDRKPNYLDLTWVFPVLTFFDYQIDAEAHAGINAARQQLFRAVVEHPKLDVNIGQPYPPLHGGGHALETMWGQTQGVVYFNLDGKAYALARYELIVVERVAWNPAGASTL